MPSCYAHFRLHFLSRHGNCHLIYERGLKLRGAIVKMNEWRQIRKEKRQLCEKIRSQKKDVKEKIDIFKCCWCFMYSQTFFSLILYFFKHHRRHLLEERSRDSFCRSSKGVVREKERVGREKNHWGWCCRDASQRVADIRSFQQSFDWLIIYSTESLSSLW